MNRRAEAPHALWSPKPTDLVALRDSVGDYLHSPHALTRTVIALANQRGTLNPNPHNPVAAAQLLFADELLRLRTARLYYVTAQMTAMSVHAGRNLPTWNVYREDLPSPSGFMVFATPIGSYLTTEYGVDHYVDIVAVSWGQTRITSDPDANCWITFWSATNRELPVEVLRAQGFGYREIRAAIAATTSDLNWDNEVVLSYNTSDVTLRGTGEKIDPADHTLVSETTIGWVQTVRAAWLMMKATARKPITDIVEQPLSKTVRKRLERDGYTGDAIQPMRVVNIHTLHRPARGPRRGPADDAGDRKWKVKTLVFPHIRWQPYPSRGEIEPIVIGLHQRGPDDAPWSTRRHRGSNTVHLLDRPPGGRPPVSGE